MGRYAQARRRGGGNHVLPTPVLTVDAEDNAAWTVAGTQPNKARLWTAVSRSGPFVDGGVVLWALGGTAVDPGFLFVQGEDLLGHPVTQPSNIVEAP